MQNASISATKKSLIKITIFQYFLFVLLQPKKIQKFKGNRVHMTKVIVGVVKNYKQSQLDAKKITLIKESRERYVQNKTVFSQSNYQTNLKILQQCFNNTLYTKIQKTLNNHIILMNKFQDAKQAETKIIQIQQDVKQIYEKNQQEKQSNRRDEVNKLIQILADLTGFGFEFQDNKQKPITKRSLNDHLIRFKLSAQMFKIYHNQQDQFIPIPKSYYSISYKIFKNCSHQISYENYTLFADEIYQTWYKPLMNGDFKNRVVLPCCQQCYTRAQDGEIEEKALLHLEDIKGLLQRPLKEQKARRNQKQLFQRKDSQNEDKKEDKKEDSKDDEENSGGDNNKDQNKNKRTLEAMMQEMFKNQLKELNRGIQIVEKNKVRKS